MEQQPEGNEFDGSSADRENITTFIAEQKEYLDKPYRRAGFRWPHLNMFKAAQETGE